MSDDNRKPVIICCGSSGRAVVFGYVYGDLPKAEEIFILHKARMVLYWSKECCGLFGLAANGPKTGTRITSEVPKISDTARQVIEVTQEAAKAFDDWISE